MKRCKVVIQPGNREIFASEGDTVMDAIRGSGADFDFPCGGKGRCGKCRVRIVGGADSPSDGEKEFLDEEEIEAGIRLACFTAIHGDMEVRLYEEKKREHKILLAGEERAVFLEPLLKKTYVEVAQPTLHDQSSDWKRLKESLALKVNPGGKFKIRLPVLRSLPETLRESQHRVTVVTEGEEVLGIEGPDTTRTMFGVAFDIGTTTVVGYLMDLLTGKEMSVVSALNPQAKFGADVITRTNFADQEKNGLEILQTAVVEAIDDLVGEAAEKAGIRRTDIYALTMVGNTCMHHLFAGLNPKYIALSPYVPVTGDALSFDAADFRIHINPAGKVFLFPNIAGFVGGDTVAVILATELDRSGDIKLAVDIGTNGEIVLGFGERLVSCSTAAGPAFEGAQISSGMRGAIGAIDHVYFGDQLKYSVIGGVKPEGICGSGLLDVVAGLVRLGIVDANGRILPPDSITNPSARPFLKHIVKNNKANAFLLADQGSTGHGRPIMITQKDVRELQLAKGAISTGIKILMEIYGIRTEDIKEVLLAGAFGNYLDPRSACAIGLLPPELENRIKMVGNAAGSGSKLALLSRSELERASQIAGSVEYVELGAYAGFYDMFVDSLKF
ncbi:MAG: ASKHA domain-containing protein [Clostridiales bacterium]|jgi:uncharacterized 2Fe-2S/4Fe-4S cluster protein (DUF4445 family)|nr:ASKHA domain-containing protein [Eubacteriales bacterium]MDH7566450.1 ASKHA domain-containing protein [Clostridiales bacterium]